MLESTSQSNNVSLSMLSDLKSFFRSGSTKRNEDSDENLEQVQNANSAVTRKALNDIQAKFKYTANTNALKINYDNTNSPSQSREIQTTEQDTPFLKFDSENSVSPFLSEEYTAAGKPSPFMEFDTNNITSPFMTFDSERPSVFFSAEDFSANIPEEPLSIQRPEDYSESGINTSVNLAKNKDTILSELRRNAMTSTMTARDIANKYGISYMQAQEIFVALNEDENGVVREFNLPQNSTVSYLV